MLPPSNYQREVTDDASKFLHLVYWRYHTRAFAGNDNGVAALHTQPNILSDTSSTAHFLILEAHAAQQYGAAVTAQGD